MGSRSPYRCRAGRISCIALPDFKKGKPARRKKTTGPENHNPINN